MAGSIRDMLTGGGGTITFRKSIRNMLTDGSGNIRVRKSFRNMLTDGTGNIRVRKSTSNMMTIRNGPIYDIYGRSGASSGGGAAAAAGGGSGGGGLTGNPIIDFFKRPAPGIRHGLRTVRAGLPLELVIGGAATIAGGILGAAQWGAPTGLSEDYTGGAIFGATREGMASATSAMGAAVGATVGSLLPGPGTIIGAIVGGIGGYMAGSTLSTPLAYDLGLAGRAIVRTARMQDRVQFGGGFVDTHAAYTMRQAAVMEMSGSMLNARQYLGNEAILFHER